MFRAQAVYQCRPQRAECRTSGGRVWLSTCGAIRSVNLSSTEVTNFFNEAAFPATYPTTTASGTVTGDGYYRTRAQLWSAKKNSDGSWGAEVLLDSRVSFFAIGAPTANAPYARFCDGADSPVTGCVAPVPAPDSTVAPGLNQQVAGALEYGVLGPSTTSKFQFRIKLRVTGPTSSTFETTKDFDGIGKAITQPSTIVNFEPGDYLAVISVTGQRIETSQPVGCGEILPLGSYSWSFKVEENSSSSSDSSGEGSSSSESSGSESSGSSESSSISDSSSSSDQGSSSSTASSGSSVSSSSWGGISSSSSEDTDSDSSASSHESSASSMSSEESSTSSILSSNSSVSSDSTMHWSSSSDQSGSDSSFSSESNQSSSSSED